MLDLHQLQYTSSVCPSLCGQYCTTSESTWFQIVASLTLTYNVNAPRDYHFEIGSIHCGKFTDLWPFPLNLMFVERPYALRLNNWSKLVLYRALHCYYSDKLLSSVNILEPNFVTKCRHNTSHYNFITEQLVYCLVSFYCKLLSVVCLRTLLFCIL